MLSRLFLLILTSILMISDIYAESCETYFPDLAQGHADGSTLQFDVQGKIQHDFQDQLAFSNLQDNTPNWNNTCTDTVNGKCEVSGGNELALTLPSFEATSSTTVRTLNSANGTTFTELEVGTLTVQNQAKVTLSPSGGDFKITNVTFTNNAEVTLQAGTYWFDNLTISLDAQVFIEGPVTLFVNNALIMSNQVEMNQVQQNGQTLKAKDLAIISYSTISLSNTAKMAAVVYGNEMDIENQAEFQGAISVTDNLTVASNAGFTTVTGEDITGITIDGVVCSETSVAPIELVAGRVTLNNTTTTPEFTHVCFDSPFSTPPLVFSIPTTVDNWDRLALRIRNVTTAGFDIAQVESRDSANPDAPAGNLAQTVDFLAIVPGDYELDGGATMRVSSITTQKFESRTLGRTRETVSVTDLNFTAAPAIIASIQTMNNEPDDTSGPFPISEPFLATTVSSVTSDSFDIALERAEVTAGTVTNAESIAYIAITAGIIGQLSDAISYKSFITPSNIRGINRCDNFDLTASNSGANPLIIASQNTRNGSDGGWVKRCAIAATSVGFSIVEDRDRDNDTAHISEEVGGLSLLGSFKDFTNTCTADVIDHYEITHGDSALTCTPTTITIKACLNADCSEVAANDVEVTLSTDTLTSTLTPNPVTIPGDSTAGVEISLSQTTPETVTLGVDTAAPNPVECIPSCEITFADSGFIFSLATANPATTIATQTACEESPTITISAVRKDDAQVTCTSAFSNATKTLNFWTDYHDPNSGTEALNLTYDSALYALAGIEGTAIDINFDNNGEAEFTINYADAGQLRLNASHDDVNLRMEGNTLFTTVPAKLIVKSDDTNADCTSTNSRCSVFKAAGDTFNLSVSATCDDEDIITPNFKMNDIPLTIDTNAPNRGNAVFLGETSIDITAAGMQTETAQTVSEVGVFTITATPPTNGYFNSTVPAGSVTIGRFIPAYFELSKVTDGELSGSPFVYTGQTTTTTSGIGEISYLTPPEFTITAKSFTDNTTLNYAANFVKLLPSGITRVIPTQDAAQLGSENRNVDLTAALTSPADVSFSNGVSNYQFNSTDNYIYTRNSNSIIAPFDASIDLQISAIEDSDGVTARDTDINSAGVLMLQPTGVEIRFGRWLMENSYGAETVDLRVPMQAQYWNGNYFITNDADSFSSFNANDATITENNLDPTSADPTPYGSGVLSSGVTSNLMIQAPSEESRGPVTVELAVPSWLKYDWSGDNNGLYDENPEAQVNFGLYRGNDRIIYRRELFE